jgi:hypothetical protein
MSYPGPIIPEVFGTQDKHDDDAQVIDSFFIETDVPPDLKPAAQTIDAPDVEVIKPCTRFLTGELNVDPTWGPTMVLPADAKRKGMEIKVFSPNATLTDGVRVASEIGGLGMAGKVFHGQSMSNALDNHTGAVWIQGFGASGSNAFVVTVEYWSVTE